jgi:hypothetical protein
VSASAELPTSRLRDPSESSPLLHAKSRAAAATGLRAPRVARRANHGNTRTPRLPTSFGTATPFVPRPHDTSRIHPPEWLISPDLSRPRPMPICARRGRYVNEIQIEKAVTRCLHSR